MKNPTISQMMNRFGRNTNLLRCITYASLNNFHHLSSGTTLLLEEPPKSVSPVAWQLALSTAVVVFSLWKISVDWMNDYPRSDHIGWDYFDDLPDDIVAFILSYVPMQDASMLRVLSRRWRYLNPFGPEINFDSHTMFRPSPYQIKHCDECCPIWDLDRFVRGVNQNIKCWNGRRIDSFRVNFCLGRKSASEIDQWINFAVRMDVQQLELSCIIGCCVSPAHNKLKHFSFYAFDTRLLSEAARLTYLSLRGCKLVSNFITGHIHSLRVLELRDVLLFQFDLRHILLKCSNLEELRLNHCECPSILSIDGPLLQLKYLLLEFLEGPKIIELSCTQLTKFECNNVEHIIFKFVQVPNLEFIKFGFPFNNWTSYVLDDLSRHAPRLQCMSVAGPVILERRVPSSPITFRNVIKVDFHSKHSDDLHSIVLLLRACPMIQNLRVMMLGYLDREDAASAATMVQLPRTIHSQLKVVEFDGFYGGETQIELIIYLLETVVRLKRMAISSKNWRMGLTGRHGQWVSDIKRLLGKAASKSAEIILDSVPITM